MRVGVPKEIKTHEYRVGLTPGAVREYVHAGHDVVIDRRGRGEPVPAVHHPVPGADQVRARAGRAVQDAGDDRLAAAVGEGFGDVARWTLDSQHGLVGADLVGQTAQ